jgi:hypothetical protein
MKKSLICTAFMFLSIISIGQVYSFNIIPTEVQNGDYGLTLVGYGSDGGQYKYSLVTDGNGQIFFENNSDYIFGLDEGLGEYFLKDEYRNQELTVSYKISDEPASFEGADPSVTFKTFTVTRIELNRAKEKNNNLSPVETCFFEKELTFLRAEDWGDGTFRFFFENENYGSFMTRTLPKELLDLTDNDPTDKYALNPTYQNTKFKLRYVMISSKETYSKIPVLEMVIFSLIK